MRRASAASKVPIHWIEALPAGEFFLLFFESDAWNSFRTPVTFILRRGCQNLVLEALALICSRLRMVAKPTFGKGVLAWQKIN